MVENLGIRFDEIPEFEGISGTGFTGDKVSIESLLNIPIAILKFRSSPSSFFEGEYCMIQVIDMNNDMKWFTTGSKVLIKQLQELESKLPLKAKIVKIKRYFTLKKLNEKNEEV